MQFSTHSDIFDKARSWKWRVLRASHSTTTGLVVQAVLAAQPDRGQAFGKHADITVDGQVMCMHRQLGKWHGPIPIGSISAVRDNVRRLADHCKLDDAEREALFTELRKWIRKDHRATSTGELRAAGA